MQIQTTTCQNVRKQQALSGMGTLLINWNNLAQRSECATSFVTVRLQTAFLLLLSTKIVNTLSYMVNDPMMVCPAPGKIQTWKNM